MNEKLTLKNTYISFTPSFMGQGWETSLLPKVEREVVAADFRITFEWLKKLIMKMQKSGQERKEEQTSSVLQNDELACAA